MTTMLVLDYQTPFSLEPLWTSRLRVTASLTGADFWKFLCVQTAKLRFSSLSPLPCFPFFIYYHVFSRRRL